LDVDTWCQVLLFTV